MCLVWPVSIKSAKIGPGSKPLQQGLTLIELMIGVAILGVLAYIALPIYTSYVERARISEALSLVESAKKAMVEHHGINGVFPTSNSKAGIPHHNDIKGTYVRRVKIRTFGGWSEPGILLRLEPKPDTWGRGAKMFWRPSSQGGSITWTCCWRNFAGGASNPFIPKFCPKEKNHLECPS